MQLIETSIHGCLELRPPVAVDRRGNFVKIFQESLYREKGLKADFREEYFSTSKKGVIRGMHFQLPPEDQVKAVFCVHGKVFDVAVDLRVGSPTYGKHVSAVLDQEHGNGLYIPRGFAHGFCAVSDDAILFYKVEVEYSPKNDTGILWNSCGIDWPEKEPILSDRDQGFVTLKDFASPFRFS